MSMNKVIVLGLSLFLATDVFAGVRMLGSSGSGVGSSSSVNFRSSSTSTYRASNARQWCLDNGYTETMCEGNAAIIVTCPKNSHYVHCCPPKYRFRKEFCESKGYIPSSDDCMGYYRCMMPASSSGY